jgi:hypothetical protein
MRCVRGCVTYRHKAFAWQISAAWYGDAEQTNRAQYDQT